MRTLSLAALCAAALCAAPLAQAEPDDPPAFPRPGARLVMENPVAFVWDVTWTPGRPTALHRHGWDIVAVDLADSQALVSGPDGSRRVLAMTPGHITLLPRGTTHVEETPEGSPPRHAVVIELKDGPAPPDAAPVAPPPGAQITAENTRVVTWDWGGASAAGGPAPVLAHPAFVVFLDPGAWSMAAPGGGMETRTLATGDVLYQPAGAPLPRPAAGPLRAVVVEMK